MAKRMNFGVGINLYTDKFKKGARQVNSYMKTMKAQVLALGAAFGVGGFALGNFFSKAADTVRSLAKAQVTLKNVTKTSTEYNKALKFLNETSTKYNQNIINLTSNYSKFQASSEGTGLALAQVRDIFESLTQASTYYNLSADETNGVMLALSQMMSKGKIQAEELRGQLGERLPGALGIMARALGVTQKELDKLMKDGKLMSSEVLPKFAEQLKFETAGFNSDSLEGAFAKLQNTWTKIWSSPEMQASFKKLVNGLTEALNFAAANIKNIFTGTILVMIAYATNALNTLMARFESQRKAMYMQYQSIAKRGNNTAVGLTPKGTTVGNNINEIYGYRNKIQSVFDSNNIIPFNQKLKESNIILNEMVKKGGSFKESAIAWEKEIGKVAQQYDVLNASAGGTIETIAAQQRAINDGARKTNMLAKSWDYVSIKAKQAGLYIKNAFMSNLPGIILAALAYIGMAISDAIKKAKELKNLAKDSIADINKAKGESTLLIAAEKLLVTYKDQKKTLDEQEKAFKDILKLLDITDTKGKDRKQLEQEINDEIKRRASLILNEARAQAAANKIVELENKKAEAQARKDKWQKETGGSVVKGTALFGSIWDSTKKAFGGKTTSENIDSEIKQIEGAIKEVVETFGDLIAEMELNKKETPTPTTNEEESPYSKIRDNYIKSLKELDGQLKHGVITQDEYTESVKKLSEDTAKAIASLGDLTPEAKELFDMLMGVQGLTENKFAGYNKEHDEEAKKLFNQFKNGAITAEEYNDSMTSLIDSTMKNIASLDGLTEEQLKALGSLKNSLSQYKNKKEVEITPYSERDKTFDYRLTQSQKDIAETEHLLDYANKRYDELKQAIADGAEGLDDAFRHAAEEADTIEAALKLRQIQAEIKDLNKELTSGVYNGIKNIASSTDRLVNAWKSLDDVMSDPDSSAWEQIITVFNTLIQTVDTLISIFDAFNSVMQIVNAITAATAATSTITTSAKTAEAAATVAANKAIGASNEYVARTGVLASASSIPFPGNLVAMGASLGALEAMLTTCKLPAFANGGIVGGSSFSGDKVLARVNSGEMILNDGQQATLFNLLNNGGSGLGSTGNVEFKIKGDNLVGVLNNNAKRKSKF